MSFTAGVPRLPQPLPAPPVRTLRQADDLITPHAAAWALEDSQGEPVILQALSGNDGPGRPGLPILWFGTPAGGALPSLLPFIFESDRLRILRLHDEADRQSVALAHAAARILLGRCLDCPAQDIAFLRDERGKPRLDPRRHGATARQIHFSISHTRELVAVAIGHRRIGVDVEAVHGFPDLMQVAGAQFAHEMLHDLMAARSDAEKVALFFRFWTLGEAFIKATGQGITQGLRSFAFSAHDPPALTRLDGPWGPCDRWRFGTLGWGAAASGTASRTMDP